MAKFQKGDKIETSGKGRTSKWGHSTGKVTKVFRDGSVEVKWDGGWLGDQMEADEVKKR